MASLEFFVRKVRGTRRGGRGRGPACRPEGDRRRWVVRDGQVPRAEHRGVLAPASAARRRRDVAGGRNGADPVPATVRRRRCHHPRNPRDVSDGRDEMGSVNLSDQPITATPYGRWQQLNGALNVNAFGINAVVCDPAEDFGHLARRDGDGPAGGVHRGHRARAFTVGDERIEAGPGTVVAAPDPAVIRGFEALEPGTRIVCVGAAPVAEGSRSASGSPRPPAASGEQLATHVGGQTRPPLRRATSGRPTVGLRDQRIAPSRPSQSARPRPTSVAAPGAATPATARRACRAGGCARPRSGVPGMVPGAAPGSVPGTVPGPTAPGTPSAPFRDTS